jgi:hypothetical protein
MNNLDDIIQLANKLSFNTNKIYQVWVCCTKDGITTYDLSTFDKTPKNKQVVYTTKLK